MQHYRGGVQLAAYSNVPVLSPSPHQQQQQQQQLHQLQQQHFQQQYNTPYATAPATSASASSSSRLHRPAAPSPPLSLHTITSPTASAVSALLRDPLTPTSTHSSSDLSPPDDEADDSLHHSRSTTPAASTTAAAAASGQPAVSAEVESLKRTIDSLHRVTLSYQLKEQALEKQVHDMQRQIDQHIVNAYKQQQHTASAAALSPSLTHSSPLSGVGSPLSSSPSTSSSPTSASTIPSLPPAVSTSLSTHVASLISHLAPTRQSEQRRISTLSYLKALVRKSLGAQCYPLASHALKTYLDDEEMTVSAFFSRAHESSWLQRIVNALCQEAYAGGGAGGGGEEKDTAVPTVSAQYLIQSVTVLFATSKQHAVVRCTIGGVDVSMYGNNVTALASLALFEHVDTLVGQSHLFKRSILLFKAWAMARSVYGGRDQEEVTSGLFLRTLMLFVFNRFHSEIRSPFDALCQLLRFCYGFDWDTYALTVYGAVLLSSLDSPRLLPATDSEHAWPADIQPLVSPAIVQQYQAQSKRVAAGGGSGADSAASPTGQSGKAGMPRVNSSAFLEIPGESGAVSRSNSETNLAGLAGLRSASSSSLSSLAAGAAVSRPPPSLSSGTARDADVRGTSYASTSSSASPTSSASFRGSKSYTSLTSLDYTPDHSPVPHSSSSSTSASFYTAPPQTRLPSIPSPSAASMAFPPTVSADAMLTAVGAAGQYESSAAAAASSEQEDDDLAAGDEDEEQSLTSEDEEDDTTTSASAASTSLPTHSSALNPLDLYLPPAASAGASAAALSYPVCSLNVLDAMERGKNLGTGVAYRWQYKVRTVLRDGWHTLCAAMERERERGRGESEVRASASDGVAGVEDVEGNAVLRELFDGATLSEYRERLYREQKAKAAAINSPSSAAAMVDGEQQQQQREKDEWSDAITSPVSATSSGVRSPATSSPTTTASSTSFSHPAATTSTVISPHYQQASPVSQSSPTAAATKSTLNPYSSEFVPSSAATTTTTTAAAVTTVVPSTSPTKSALVPLSTSASSSASSHLSFPSSTAGDDPLSRSQSPPLPATLTPAHLTFDPLDGNLPKILTHLSHARQFEVPTLSLPDLLTLLSTILAHSGPVPVGRLGSLLHERTNNHSLPALLKEEYGGLKRLLERYPDSFVVGKDHPYNPHVSVKGGVVVAGGGVGGVSGGGSGGGGGKVGGVGGGKKKVQRRRTRVRRLNHRGSSNNLAALSTGGGAVGSTSGLTPSLSATSLAAAARPPLTPVVAIDCEMIGVGSGGLHSILARVSIVSSTYDVLYDSYVAPPPAEPITDYRTHVSGITPSLLHSAPSFATVQREVASIIKGRVLIGHGLVGDLQALCLNHPRGLQRDTAHFRLLCPVRPIALKRLLDERLGIVVQEGVHDSVEDARGAMMLYESVASEWEESLVGMAGVNTEQSTTVYQIM